MREVSGAARVAAIKTVRPFGREDEAGSVLSDIASTLWPTNTAAHIASLVGCSVRAAERYLGGQREWSGDAVAVIVAEILKRHSMRNVKITKR